MIMGFNDDLQKRKNELLLQQLEKERKEREIKERHLKEERIKKEIENKLTVYSERACVLLNLSLESELTFLEMKQNLKFTTPARVEFISAAGKKYGVINTSMPSNCKVFDFIYRSTCGKDNNYEYHICFLPSGEAFLYNINKDYDRMTGSTSNESAYYSIDDYKTGIIEYLAKADVDKKTNKIEETTKSSSGGCYIATAVYGSYDCPQVWVLRRYRDNVLLQSPFGRLFVKTYYAISPTIVKLFGNSNVFKMIWKPYLDNKVNKLKESGFSDEKYND